MKLFQKYRKLIIGVIFVLTAEIVDLLTGPEIAFSIFYLLVSAYFAWYLGFRAGVISAVLLGILSVITDHFSGVHYSYTAIPFWTALMRIATFVIVVCILSRLQNREKELEKAVIELKQSNAELDNFALVVSHDLQEPLYTIEMYCQLLENKVHIKLRNEKEYLVNIKESVQRMQRLIKNLLTYAKTSRRNEWNQPVDLKILIQELLKDLQAPILKKKAVIEVEELPTVNSNPIQMKQVFQNLIGNALKFSREHVPPYIKIYSRIKEDVIEIYIKDNGLGFEEKHLDKIFTPFERLHGHVQGTGIGLPTCKRIIEQYNGKITAKSRVKEGSTFIVKLPKKLLHKN